jgi:hypothetical protein
MALPGEYTPRLPVKRAFVVQVDATAAVTRGRFSGRVEQVVSAQATHFHSVEALLAFIQQVLTTACECLRQRQ